MDTEHTRTHCIRCGECCLKSSPTLQDEDLPLVKNGLILTHDLYTIRTGELVCDNINNQLKISEFELIKLKEKNPGKGCIQYDDMDFIFGKPLTETITMFGLKVTREPDGSFFLTMEQKP